MNATTRTVSEAIAAISALPGVKAARVWRNQIYVDTFKRNGGVNWNNGRGFNQLYIDSRGVHVGDVAGAATWSYHETLGTIGAIKEIAATIAW